MHSKQSEYILVVQVTRQLTIDIANYFAAKGDRVTILTGSLEPNYAKPDPSIRFKYYLPYDNRSGLRRIFTWGIFTLQCAWYLLFANSRNTLLLITTPPFTTFLGWIFNLMKGMKYHLIIWDLYPDVMVKFGYAKPGSPALKLWEWANRKSFGRASSLITLGEHIAQAMLAYSKEPAVIIPNWTNTNFIRPMDQAENRFIRKYHLEGKLVVMYSGNWGLTHDIEAIVKAADELRMDNEIHFVIIGDGAKRKLIETMVADLGLKNVLLLPYQDQEMLPHSLSAADIGVVTLSKGAESISVPSKTYYTMAAGSLILALADSHSELGNLITKYDCGVVMDSGEVSAIAAFITEMRRDSHKLGKYKQNARMAAGDFTPANAAKYYQTIKASEESTFTE